MASLPDPSEFAVSVGAGSAHILASLGLATHSPVAAVALALPVLVAYLAAVTLSFAVRVAADGCARIVNACGGDATAVAQLAAAVSPSTVFGWFADLIVRLAVRALLISLVPSSPLPVRRCSELTAGESVTELLSLCSRTNQ